MWINLQKILFCFAVMQIFGQFVEVESRNRGKKRVDKKKSMLGVGLLAGGIAGGLTGVVAANMLNKPKEIHHYHHMAGSETSTSNTLIANSAPVTTIQKGETLSNGCYKQIVTEPVPNDSTRFTRTEQLICPQTIPLTANNQTYVQPLPGVVIPQPVVQLVQTPVQIDPTKQEEKFNASTFAPPYTAVLQPFATNTSNALPPQPVVRPPSSVIAAPPQIIILSKTTGSYDQDKKRSKNAASNLFANKFTIAAAIFVVALSLL